MGQCSYPGPGSVGQDVGVRIWGKARGPILWSLEEGIAALAVAAVTMPWADVVARENARVSYCALLQDCEGCSSYVKDIGYRTSGRGDLSKAY